MQSNSKLNKFTRSGQYVQISFNEREIESAEGETQYKYDYAKVSLLAKRDDVIQSLMRIKYKDIDAEFAANLNGGDEQLAHSEWRETCKSIADDFEVYVKSELSP